MRFGRANVRQRLHATVKIVSMKKVDNRNSDCCCGFRSRSLSVFGSIFKKTIELGNSKSFTGTIANMVTATGTVEPITQVEVGTQVSGIINKIYVDYNSIVKKGQVIAELDKTTLESELRPNRPTWSRAVRNMSTRLKTTHVPKRCMRRIW